MFHWSAESEAVSLAVALAHCEENFFNRFASLLGGLRCAEIFDMRFTRHLRFSALCAPRDVPGYYLPSLSGLRLLQHQNCVSVLRW